MWRRIREKWEVAEHKKFKITSLIIGILLLPPIILNNYYHLENQKTLHIKTIPIFLCFLLSASYFFLYRPTVFSCLTSFGLLFCLVGDILLGLYDPNIQGISKEDRITILILGGAFFLFARTMYTISFMLKYTGKLQFLIYPYRYVFIHAITVGGFAILGILTIVYLRNLISYFIFTYILLGFGFPLSYAFLKLYPHLTSNDKENTETMFCRRVSLVAMALFNLSDILLLVVLFTTWVPSFVLVVSEDIYWLSMYLVSISPVRYATEREEMGEIYLPLQ